MKISYNRKRRDPTREGQIPVQYGPAKRTLANLKWRLTLLIVLSPFIYFGLKMMISMFIAPSSGFVVLDLHPYQSPADSVVQEIKVERGQQVNIGDQLIVLKDQELDYELARIQRTIDGLLADPEDDSISGEYLLKQKKLAEDAVVYQKKRLANISFLYQQRAATVAEQKAALSQLNTALSQLNGADYQLKQWSQRQQQTPKDLRKTPEFTEAFAKLEKLESKRQQLSVMATYAGQVTEISVTQGQVVQKGGEMISVARQDRQVIASFMQPSDVDRVQQGEIADIIFPSGKIIKGRVQYNPSVTGRLPSYLATPMLGRQRMVIVHLVPVDPIPEEERIDGLPVEVNFITPLQQIIDKVKNMFT
ncbi:HlyD family secretion protein [Desulfosediminicola ganghwensis]|uniref:HlyD family secretion protein n=1 Tax=Desulfosediminicola ganghwensis TaxID=2569540 RepID=UPI0010ACBC09|nr:biotin/lipoyl-binding protein [Desulfosediminicola ganghwensis]